MVTRRHLPHAMLARLHIRKSNVVIITPEAHPLSVGFSIQDEAMDVARSAPQGAHYHADVQPHYYRVRQVEPFHHLG